MEKRARITLTQFVVCLLVISLEAGRVQAQNGSNAIVYSPSGTVVTSPSYALVDATTFSGSDICGMIASVFASYNATSTPNLQGVVIDARGVSTPANCTSNPWSSFGASGRFSNIVLLPSGTITIQATWVLPDDTRLIGEGPTSTFIAAGSSLTGGDMIDMGTQTGYSCSSGPDCPGIDIEHLGLIGNGNVNGIVNCCAQELSHVNDVSISSVQTGLSLSAKFAENSGPYTNLTISNASVACLSIGPGTTTSPMANSRGIHGLSCSVTSSSTSAITVDGPYNSLEDISISGSSLQDGILIGAQAPAQGNVLVNVQGSGLKNVIHISGNYAPATSASNCPEFVSTIQFYACDITIYGAARSGGTNTIQDDLSSPGQGIIDSTMAMYVLGETVQNLSGTTVGDIGYSRLTTATASGNTPTWLVGGFAPTGSACAVGSLYSCTGTSTQCTSGTITGAVWECIGGGTWKKIQ
jgi:hypothetical protein